MLNSLGAWTCKKTQKLMTFKGTSLGSPTGHDSASFWDKGTEVPSLSRDKGTTGQAQNLAIGQGQPVKIRDKTGQSLIFSQNLGQDGTITISFLKIPVLEHLFLF